MSIILTIIEIQMSILKIVENKIRIFIQCNVLVAASCLRGYAKDETYFYKILFKKFIFRFLSQYFG